MLMSSAAEWLSPYVSVPPEELLGRLEVPPSPEMGDLSLPCFPLAKTLRQAPQAIAESLAERITASGSGEIRAAAAGGYLNLFFAADHWKSDIVNRAGSAEYGNSDIGSGRRVVIDLSSPNIAKPFGVGHLRSTMIGNALANLYRAVGHEVVTVNHLGDWGTQFGKLIAAYRRWGSEDTLAQEPIRESLRLYVRFHEEAERDPALEEEGREAFAQLERGDPDALGLWRFFVDESSKEFRRVYDRLGVGFDHWTGESFYNDKIASVVEELEKRSLLEEDDGARIVRLEERGMPPCLILKKDGSTIYAVRDLATALYRRNVLGADTILYVVGAEQSLHFQQVFAVLDKMGHAWSAECRHVPFGLMTMNGKKMSTRKGKVVFLEEVLDEAVQRARQIIDEKNPELPDKERVAQAVGVGAVIFGDLKHHRQLSVDFNLEDAVSFDGETGPYVQYAYARICALLRRGRFEELRGKHAVNGAHLASEEAWECLKTLDRFEAVIREAVRENEPYLVARFLLDLAQSFNRFYNAGRILGGDADEGEIASKLGLASAVALTLKRGLGLLGIAAPAEM